MTTIDEKILIEQAAHPYESIITWIKDGEEVILETFLLEYISKLEDTDKYFFFFLCQLVAIDAQNELMISKLRQWYDDYFSTDGTTWAVRVISETNLQDNMISVLYDVYNTMFIEVSKDIIRFVSPATITWFDRLFKVHQEAKNITIDDLWEIYHERESMVDAPAIDDLLIYLENLIVALSPLTDEPGYLLDNPGDILQNIKKEIGPELSQFNEYRNTDKEVINKIQLSVELFRLFGPVNILTADDLTVEDDCSDFGGCRMFLCQCQEEDDSISDWFLGYCEVCFNRLSDRRSAIRRPLITGGWQGCYCSESCGVRGILNNSTDISREKNDGFETYEDWENSKIDTTLLEQYMLAHVVSDINKYGIYRV